MRKITLSPLELKILNSKTNLKFLVMNLEHWEFYEEYL